MIPSRALPKSMGFRQLISYLHFLRTRIEAQGLYWRPWAPGDTMYGELPHIRTLSSWRPDQENQISTTRQKQLQNNNFRLWFWHFLHGQLFLWQMSAGQPSLSSSWDGVKWSIPRHNEAGLLEVPDQAYPDKPYHRHRPCLDNLLKAEYWVPLLHLLL